MEKRPQNHQEQLCNEAIERFRKYNPETLLIPVVKGIADQVSMDISIHFAGAASQNVTISISGADQQELVRVFTQELQKKQAEIKQTAHTVEGMTIDWVNKKDNQEINAGGTVNI